MNTTDTYTEIKSRTGDTVQLSHNYPKKPSWKNSGVGRAIVEIDANPKWPTVDIHATEVPESGRGTKEVFVSVPVEAITNLLDAAKPKSSRPSLEVRKDRLARFNERCERDRQHIRKTFELNMKDADNWWNLAHHGKVTNQMNLAIHNAARCLVVREFVIGVIAGRGADLPEAEREALKREWEEMWDKAFGDLIGEILHFQD